MKKTKGEKLHESEEHFRILAENLPNMLFINVNGRVVYTNNLSAKILGYSKKEIYDGTFNFLEVTAPESRELVKKNFKLHMAGEEVEPYEYVLITRNGEKLNTILYSKLITYKGQRAILGTVVDITKQKDAEEQLIEQERRKDEFITIASHELKTPITSLKLYNQILIKSPAQSKEYLQRMHEQIEKLSSLVDQLLDVSKIQSGNIQLMKEEFSFPVLIKKTIEMIKEISPNHSVAFINNGVSKVIADRGRIEQVLINLITNAVKYSPDSKRIKITARRKNGEVIIVVKDTGIGIEEKHITRIFERFYRTTTAAKNKLPGLGMGLYISHEIIKLHEGKMWVKSKYGKGSSFYFSLPASG